MMIYIVRGYYQPEACSTQIVHVQICIGNHTHSSLIREIIVHAIVKIGRGESPIQIHIIMIVSMFSDISGC